MKSPLVRCFVFGVALVATPLLQASPITIIQEVDLVDFKNFGYDLHFSAAPFTQITNGDDVTVTFTFAHSDRLQLNNSTATATSFSTGWPWLECFGASGDFTLSNISITLLAPSVLGTADTAVTLTDQTDGDFHLGPLGYLNLGANSTVSFSGVTATYHVQDLPGGTNIYQPWIHGYFDADFSIIRPSAQVPDVLATAPALLLGFLVLLGLRRRL